jgi:hypothetical protein
MPKHFDADILEFLKKQENLSFALEIGHYAAELRERISTDFWTQLRAKLVADKPSKFGKTELTITRIGSGSYIGWLLVPSAASKQNQALGFAVEWESLQDNHDIYVGLRWKIPVPKKDKLYSNGAVADLRTIATQNGYEAWDYWWLCGSYILNYPNADAFVIAYNNEPTSIENSLSTAFWKMATHYGNSLDQINARLAKM